MFKLMWSMKNKGDKLHYKPGVKDKLKSKYKEEVEMEGVDVYGDAPKRKQHPGQKKGTAKLKKGWKMTPSGEPYVKKESKETEDGERDVGGGEYARYVKRLTPVERSKAV